MLVEVMYLALAGLPPPLPIAPSERIEDAPAASRSATVSARCEDGGLILAALEQARPDFSAARVGGAGVQLRSFSVGVRQAPASVLAEFNKHASRFNSLDVVKLSCGGVARLHLEATVDGGFSRAAVNLDWNAMSGYRITPSTAR